MRHNLAAVLALLCVTACASGPRTAPQPQPSTVSALSGSCIYLLISRELTSPENAALESCQRYVDDFSRERSLATACPRAQGSLIEDFLRWARTHPEHADAPASYGLNAALEDVEC